MTTEDKLKQLILSRFNSIREFTQIIEMSYSTMDSILKRGIGNANVTNIIRICKALGISADALCEGEIVPIQKNMTDLKEIIDDMKARLLETDTLTLGGKPIDNTVLQSIIDQIDLVVALAEKKNA